MLRFVINLNTSVTRWKHMQKSLKELNIQVMRVEAVNGKLLTDKEKDIYLKKTSSFLEPSYRRNLTASEIGCFLSHRKCWEILSQSKEKWALVMEDDILFSKRAQQYINSYSWIPSKVNIVQLFSFDEQSDAKILDDKIQLPNDDCLIRLVHPIPWGCQAYWISKIAAEEALRASVQFSVPVDDFLFNPIYNFSKKFPVYRLDPAVILVQPADAAPSTIGNRKVLETKKGNLVYYINRLLLYIREIFFSRRYKISFK